MFLEIDKTFKQIWIPISFLCKYQTQISLLFVLQRKILKSKIRFILIFTFAARFIKIAEKSGRRLNV
jgi:hypothetical protein